MQYESNYNYIQNKFSELVQSVDTITKHNFILHLTKLLYDILKKNLSITINNYLKYFESLIVCRK